MPRPERQRPSAGVRASIASTAARLMAEDGITDYHHAKKKAARVLGREVMARRLEKTYWALVYGVPEPRTGSIDLPLIKADEAKVPATAVKVVPQGGPAKKKK